MVKRTDTTGAWQVYHRSLANTEYLVLNTTAAVATGATRWDSTTPTSTVFSLGTDASVNASGGTFIAYCFAEVKGYSKFGSYTGNGSTDGTFIYTGFKPAFVMIKRTDSAFGWYIYDSVRDPENENTKALLPSESDAENNEAGMDLLSNGFKLRNTGAGRNPSGGNIIYMAFADSPFVSSKAIPTTAR
jgi:hypothetical protein